MWSARHHVHDTCSRSSRRADLPARVLKTRFSRVSAGGRGVQATGDGGDGDMQAGLEGVPRSCLARLEDWPPACWVVSRRDLSFGYELPRQERLLGGTGDPLCSRRGSGELRQATISSARPCCD